MIIYRNRPNLTIGFHGCDESVRNQLVNNPNFVKSSQETYDWLGNGFYLWENNYERAFQWAKDKQARKTLTAPSVVGVVYLLDNCLDLTDATFINLLPDYYELLKEDLKISGKTLPQNKDLPKDQYHDLILRELDCAVIEYLHQKIEEKITKDTVKHGFSPLTPFDTIRGIFTEGGPVYEGAGIQSKNHIQVCIRNLNCIKGFFIPREETPFP
jgi:dihydrofolate reductase